MKRNKQLISLILAFSFLLGITSCKKTSRSSESDTSTTPSASESEVESETTTTLEETTSESETSETEVPSDPTDVSDSSASETDLPTEPSDPTAPIADPPAPTDSVAPTAAPSQPTTAPTNPPAPADPTSAPAPATPTLVPPTPTPDPGINPPGSQNGTAKSAAKSAIQDYCGGHEGFEFNDTVMNNQQSRAQYASDNRKLGHYEMPGTFQPLEACATFNCDYTGEKWVYSWDNHYYDDISSCVYDLAVYLVTQHTDQLSTDSSFIYFGVGCVCYSETDEYWKQFYGMDIPTYKYTIYIGADNDVKRAAHGY